jgi:hypothetical protein
MSSKELDELVIGSTGGPSILWIPEDYGFENPKGMPGVWYLKNLELRSLSNNFWLLRKKVKNKNNNTEMLLKWRMQILPSEKGFADILFSKGLR